jgi:hypothetical protein
MINGVLAKVHISLDRVDVRNNPMIIYSVPEFIIGIEILNYLQNLRISYQTCDLRVLL